MIGGGGGGAAMEGQRCLRRFRWRKHQPRQTAPEGKQEERGIQRDVLFCSQEKTSELGEYQKIG